MISAYKNELQKKTNGLEWSGKYARNSPATGIHILHYNSTKWFNSYPFISYGVPVAKCCLFWKNFLNVNIILISITILERFKTLYTILKKRRILRVYDYVFVV